MTELAPCPFCHAKDGEPHGPTVFTENRRSFVGCIICGARGPVADNNETLAKTHWNKGRNADD